MNCQTLPGLQNTHQRREKTMRLPLQSETARSLPHRSCTSILVGGLAKTAAAFMLVAAIGWADPVRVSPVNPHYFIFNEKPLVLITSDHHYGAVIDKDFDFARFLEYLSRQGMNLTRIYPGGMFEAPDKYIPGNPLGPRPGRQILPWAKSAQAGAHPALAEPGQPSYKYDLDRWNPDYFTRLRAFVELAGEKGIIVEAAFFNGMYADCWPLMAMYHGNNIQNVGGYEAEDCGLFTTADSRNEGVLRYQKAYVAKITTELNGFDHVIFDLCDEPSLAGRMDGSILNLPDSQVEPWLQALKEAFLEAEARLPKKHLLGQTIQNLSPDLSGESWCAWLPTEYVRPAGIALEKNYGANKPIVDVESDYFGVGLVKPYSPEDVRVEGWWFMLGGGAGFINLNGEYCRGQESGGRVTQEKIVPQKKVLRDFIESFDFVRMARFTHFSGMPSDAFASAIAEKGKQYGLYLFHGASDGKWGAHFIAKAGSYRDTITLSAVPAGNYQLEWLDPATGTVKETKSLKWSGGDLAVTTPEYSIDAALRMRARL
jgi:hypothetical protein